MSHYKNLKRYINWCLGIVFISSLFVISCTNNNTLHLEDLNNDLESLPIDTGGIHTPYILGSTPAVYGHYIYTPSEYENDSQEYPLLIYLHGSGGRGNSETQLDALDKVLTNGPPKLINNNTWSPTYPMVVASPQLTSGNWNPFDVHDFISYIIENYTINLNRIYITGLSLGGFGTFNYVSILADDSYATAIVPIAGGGNELYANEFNNTAVWAFHGDQDNTVSYTNSIEMIDAINSENPITKAKLTIYEGVGHNSWGRTYDGSGMGDESIDYDPFNMSIYDWMFLFEKQTLK